MGTHTHAPTSHTGHPPQRTSTTPDIHHTGHPPHQTSTTPDIHHTMYEIGHPPHQSSQHRPKIRKHPRLLFRPLFILLRLTQTRLLLRRTMTASTLLGAMIA